MATKERKARERLRQYETQVADNDVLEVINTPAKTKVALRGNTVVPHEEIKEIPYMPDSSDTIRDYESMERKSHEIIEEKEDLQARRRQARMARKLTARTIFEAAVAVCLVVLMGVLVLLLLGPQTELSELARDNSNLKDEVSTLKTQILDAEENANGITDMDTIRAQALALGMQDPNQNQVISLPVPSNDSLTTVVTYDVEGINDEALAVAEDALADYYLAHPDS